MGPHLLAGIDIPRLHLADVVGSGNEIRRVTDAGICAARRVRYFFISNHRPAEVLIGRNVDHPCLRAERDRRPVLAAPKRGAEVRHFSGPRLSFGIHFRPASLGVNALEYVLMYEWLAFNKIDLAAL